MESLQYAFLRDIDKPCALPPSFQKNGSKREFLHLALPFIFTAGNRRHFKLAFCDKCSKSQSTDDKPSLKWEWSRLRDLFNFWKISDSISKTVVSIKLE